MSHLTESASSFRRLVCVSSNNKTRQVLFFKAPKMTDILVLTIFISPVLIINYLLSQSGTLCWLSLCLRFQVQGNVRSFLIKHVSCQALRRLCNKASSRWQKSKEKSFFSLFFSAWFSSSSLPLCSSVCHCFPCRDGFSGKHEGRSHSVLGIGSIVRQLFGHYTDVLLYMGYMNLKSTQTSSFSHFSFDKIKSKNTFIETKIITRTNRI